MSIEPNNTESIAAGQQEGSTDIASQKAAMRQVIHQRRKAMTLQLRKDKSSAICRELINCLTPTNGKVIGVYSSLSQEPSLDAFITHAYKQGAIIAFPCMMKPTAEGLPQTMEFRAVSMNQYHAAKQLQHWNQQPAEQANLLQGDMPLGGWGESVQKTAAPFVANPLRSFGEDENILDAYPLIDPTSLDQLVCPLVAFDDKGNRLGYGGGNYDRYVPKLSDSCQVVGVAFSEQHVEEVPTEEHDIEIPIISA